MGYVRQFCSDFADDYSHHGDFVGAGGGAAAAGAAGVSPNYYEPNCTSRNAIPTISANESESTDSDWEQCIDVISPSSSISDGWICATESDAADSVAAEASHSCYAGLARRVL